MKRYEFNYPTPFGLRLRTLREEEIPLAQRLLHEVYVIEHSWTPPLSNPSDLRCEDGRLRDDYEHKATWIGVFDKTELVGCMRALHPRDGLELSRYIPLPQNLKFSVETNRLSVKKAHRGGPATLLIYVGIFLVGWYYWYDNFVTAVTCESASKIRALGWQPTGITFKYSSTDKYEVELLYIPRSVWTLPRLVLGWVWSKVRSTIRKFVNNVNK